MKKYLSLLPIPLFIVVLDIISKNWVVENLNLYEQKTLIPKIFGLYYTQNTGAAFGILSNGKLGQILLATISSLALVMIIIAVAKKFVNDKLGLFSLALVFGGALGNLIDRITLGYVVDMFEFLFVKFAVFNVADIFVVTGCLLFCLDLLIIDKHQKAKDKQ